MKVEADFRYQYVDYKEEVDPEYHIPLIDKIEKLIIVDSDHGYNLVIRKSVTRLISFLASTLIR